MTTIPVTKLWHTGETVPTLPMRRHHWAIPDYYGCPYCYVRLWKGATQCDQCGGKML